MSPGPLRQSHTDSPPAKMRTLAMDVALLHDPSLHPFRQTNGCVQERGRSCREILRRGILRLRVTQTTVGANEDHAGGTDLLHIHGIMPCPRPKPHCVDSDCGACLVHKVDDLRSEWRRIA